MNTQPVNTVDEYIATHPVEVQLRMLQIRAIIRKTAPDVTEKLSYGMPAYALNGTPLAYFAGYRNHIGFYPIPSSIEAFKAQLAGYRQGKGSVQFQHSKPLPLELIEQMVQYRKTVIRIKNESTRNNKNDQTV
jgi:uncharacterized protein YdhG (YjbR/CyaY superfamily)